MLLVSSQTAAGTHKTFISSCPQIKAPIDSTAMKILRPEIGDIRWQEHLRVSSGVYRVWVLSKSGLAVIFTLMLIL